VRICRRKVALPVAVEPKFHPVKEVEVRPVDERGAFGFLGSVPKRIGTAKILMKPSTRRR